VCSRQGTIQIHIYLYLYVYIELNLPWLLQHTNILLFLIMERLFIYHKYPDWFSGLSALLGFAVIYQLWSVLEYFEDMFVT